MSSMENVEIYSELSIVPVCPSIARCAAHDRG